MKFLLFLVVVALACCVFFYGCNGPDKNTQQQVSQTAQNVYDSGKKTFARVGKEAQQVGGQMSETWKVKEPIDASKDIDSSHISVTTIDKTITIDGSVPNQEQWDKVQKMAEANADKGYKIENNLKVSPNYTNDASKAKDSGSNPPITDNQNH